MSQNQMKASEWLQTSVDEVMPRLEYTKAQHECISTLAPHRNFRLSSDQSSAQYFLVRMISMPAKSGRVVILIRYIHDREILNMGFNLFNGKLVQKSIDEEFTPK